MKISGIRRFDNPLTEKVGLVMINEEADGLDIKDQLKLLSSVDEELYYKTKNDQALRF